LTVLELARSRSECIAGTLAEHVAPLNRLELIFQVPSMLDPTYLIGVCILSFG
jgi:hypothetical protein